VPTFFLLTRPISCVKNSTSQHPWLQKLRQSLTLLLQPASPVLRSSRSSWRRWVSPILTIFLPNTRSSLTSARVVKPNTSHLSRFSPLVPLPPILHPACPQQHPARLAAGLGTRNRPPRSAILPKTHLWSIQVIVIHHCSHPRRSVCHRFALRMNLLILSIQHSSLRTTTHLTHLRHLHQTSLSHDHRHSILRCSAQE